MLIVGGRKIQAEDVEASLADYESGARPGGAVALSIEVAGQERLVVIQEVHAARDLEATVRLIRARIAESQQLPVWAVVLARPGAIPRTSSGKVQRAAAQALFANHQFESLYEWQAPSP